MANVLGFADFLNFAQSFGRVAADPDFEVKFDLDGSIGFTDFLTFAGNFGTTVA